MYKAVKVSDVAMMMNQDDSVLSEPVLRKIMSISGEADEHGLGLTYEVLNPFNDEMETYNRALQVEDCKDFFIETFDL